MHPPRFSSHDQNITGEHLQSSGTSGTGLHTCAASGFSNRLTGPIDLCALAGLQPSPGPAHSCAQLVHKAVCKADNKRDHGLW